MSRVKISTVLDQVLETAVETQRRQQAEREAVKVAAAVPRSELSRGLRDLASSLRADADDITYTDLGGKS